MKIFFFIIVSLLLLEGCGKKSDPEYQVKIKKVIYSSISNSYHLSTNYPNPFNAITSIDLSIPIDQFISMKVYDILGNEIAILINDNLSVGKHSIQWDASHYSSGLYFVKLECENYYNMRKILLLK